LPRVPGCHLLVLTDRDWTHPQGGGTGTHLYGLVSRWLAWGHRVTVVSAGHPGAARVDRPAPGLELHHLGGRLTLFLRAPWAVRRRLARDADAVLEVVNGIAFLTPLWAGRRRRVALVHHVHRDMYVEELGRRGALAAWLLETLPLRHLYGGTPFVTGSESAKAGLVELGVAPERVTVVHYGVEAEAFPPGRRTPEPTLVYLGRLKRYKRLELLLDVVEALPGVRLEIAGEGDHRAALEAEVAARGLEGRVTLHGHVDEATKRELLATAWVNLTASSAEGWCLAVMEAAAAGTPSAALRVGGLAESIVDGETGVLADQPAELTARVGALLADDARREAMGRAARQRAGTFTWERAAARTLELLARAPRPVPLRRALPRRLATEPAGVAAATLAASAGSLATTMVVARALGAEHYGALAALASLFLILSVPGGALQVAAARESARGRLGDPAALAATLARWQRRLLLAAAAGAGLAAVARAPLAALAGVQEDWAAATVVPAGALWLAVCVRRGALQGTGRHGPVAASLLVEALVRTGAAVAFVLAGAGVTGALAAIPLGLLAALALLARTTPARGVPAPPSAAVPRLRALLASAWQPVAVLTALAAVQQLDVIVAQHRLPAAEAGAYAAAAVASKVVVWAAAGLALALLPEVSRHARRGAADAGRLARTLVLVAGAAAPFALACAVAGGPLLRLVFGAELDGAAGALPWLAVAMSLFALAYVAVQHALALGRRAVLPVLAAAAVAEPLLLRAIAPGPEDLAAALAGVQLVVALAAVAIGIRAAAGPRLGLGR
jgi:glycosyltransferase involved in cell wall biosynthesis/O-antigen/teichoic acid export membrane protein